MKVKTYRIDDELAEKTDELFSFREVEDENERFRNYYISKIKNGV